MTKTTKSKLGLLTTCVMFTAMMVMAPTVMSMPSQYAYALAGGPVVLIGIDAEDGGVGAHGPISVYDDVITDMLSNVSNGGSGILVVGGAGPCGSVNHVVDFWNQIGTDVGRTVTFVNGAANISSQSFVGFEIIAIASANFQTPCGGIVNAENDALALRQADIATHVNNGGGLFGLSQQGLSNLYGYIAGLGGFTINIPSQYSAITPTTAGLTIGITDALDICCWHDEYIVFPSFLNVLATNDASSNAAAIGGAQVIIEGQGCTPGFWKNNSDKHDALAWETYSAADNFDTTFGVDISIKWSDKGKPQNTNDFSLQQALEAKGGGLNTLARHGTAALLNAANGDIGGLSAAQVIQQVQDAVAAFDVDDLDTFNDILDDITDNNEQVCPINQQGNTI